MVCSMTDAELVYVYWALSDAFVDTEDDYEAIARQTENYDAEEIRRILYHEVAPVCHANLETVIPMIWSAFNLKEKGIYLFTTEIQHLNKSITLSSTNN